MWMLRLDAQPATAGLLLDAGRRHRGALGAARRCRVQATLWSGKNQFDTTGGFVNDERRVLQILTGYLGGGTAFPIHILRDTYAARKPSDRPAHILVISDDGVTTMFDKDERGASGWDVAATALAQARGGGTLVLNLPKEIAADPDLVKAQTQGWEIHRVRTWEELVAFARAFSARSIRNRKCFGKPESSLSAV